MITSSLFDQLAIAISKDLAGEKPDENQNPPQDWRTIASFLGNILVLHGIPFSYLAPDSRMLPEESLKFFHIDGEWMNALVSGVLTVARPADARILAGNTAIGAFAAEIVRVARDARQSQRRLADADRAESAPLAVTDTATDMQASIPLGGMTGFLMRSHLLDSWPGLELSAEGQPWGKNLDKDAPLTFLRLDRPAPGVLLGLVDGRISRLIFRQPPESLHFAVKSAQATDKDRRVNLSALNAQRLQKGEGEEGAAGLAKHLIAPQHVFEFKLPAATV